MPRFPYMNFPMFYNKNYSKFSPPYYYSPYYSPSNNNHFNSSNNVHDNPNNNTRDNIYSNNHNKITTNCNINHANTTSSYHESPKNKSNSNDNDYLFDLFGLKLYFDDILILSLLFFLYVEGIKDDMLFTSLLLLLLS